MSEKPKVYQVTLHSREGKKIYVEPVTRKHAVEAADRLHWNCLMEYEWLDKHWYNKYLRLIFGPPKFDYPGDRNE